MTAETRCMGGVVAGITILINKHLTGKNFLILMKNMGHISWISKEEKYIGVVSCFEDLVFCIKNPQIVEKRLKEMEATDESIGKL